MDLFRNVDIEGADCGWRGVRRRGRLRLGHLRRYSALPVRVALAHDAFAPVCARERERTACQPSKALHGDLPSPLGGLQRCAAVAVAFSVRATASGYRSP